MSLELAGTIIAIIALGLSSYTFWYIHIRRGKPQFVCSRWTAIRMEKDGVPVAAFMVQIGVINKGGIALEVRDFIIVTRNQAQRICFYEPLLLWDLTQWIEDGDRKDKVGRTQKGQVPLPAMIQPNQSYDFGYPILFLPIDTSEMVSPNSDYRVVLDLYVLTDRSKTYKKIGVQEFTGKELQEINKRAFAGVRSSSAVKFRSELLQKLRKV